MLSNIENNDKPLEPSVLKNPGSDTVKTLVKIYTMESFIVYKMNETSYMRDVSILPYYGPFATALSFIVGNGNS